MLAKLIALALFFLANVSAVTLSVPDQADWGTVVPITFSDFQLHDSTHVDLLLSGVTVEKTYIIAYQFHIYKGVINVVLPPVVDLGEQYQFVATQLNGNNGDVRSNEITVY